MIQNGGERRNELRLYKEVKESVRGEQGDVEENTAVKVRFIQERLQEYRK